MTIEYGSLERKIFMVETDKNRDIMEAIHLASALHQLSQHNRQVVFGLFNDLLMRDKDKSLLRNEIGETYNRHGGVGKPETGNDQ